MREKTPRGREGGGGWGEDKGGRTKAGKGQGGREKGRGKTRGRVGSGGRGQWGEGVRGKGGMGTAVKHTCCVLRWCKAEQGGREPIGQP